MANTAAPRRPENRVVRIDGAVCAGELSQQLGVKSSDVLKALWRLGLRVTLNDSVDADTAALVAEPFGYRVEDVGYKEERFLAAPTDDAVSRPPVVTILGHVDHGKTTLLDAIRRSEVAKSESGGITQHLGAYRVPTAVGDLVILDTPGHEAFCAVRERGANVTDLVVLVVAADDGVMPTTIESIRIAEGAGVPIVVALNKMDKAEANPGRVKQQLMEYGLVGEEFGGSTVICEVSAQSGEGLGGLLDAVALQAELLDLRAPCTGPAHAVVLDAWIDRGHGPMASVLVTSGRLDTGAFVIAGEIRGKVRTMLDGRGQRLSSIGPSMVAHVVGFNGVPAAGEVVVEVSDEGISREIVEHRRHGRRATGRRDHGVSLQHFLTRRSVPALRIVLKANHRGSVEVLEKAISAASTDRVRIEIVSSGVGPVGESDVKLAHASGGVVLAFNVNVGARAAAIVAAVGVDAESFEVIYDLLAGVRTRMVALLEPGTREEPIGCAEVRALFRVDGVGVVAGCRVLDGAIRRSSHARVTRAGEVVFDGQVQSLRIHENDVSAVAHGRECGISFAGWEGILEGDRIDAYTLTEIAPSLGC